jgi:hypothetical protein
VKQAGRGISAMALVALVLALPVPAAAQEARRQSAQLAFTTAHPASPSGLVLRIDYFAAGDDPEGKPYAVQTVLDVLAEGARIDTGVPQQCGASDAELIAQGPEACPSGSRVGRGEVDVDTGAPGPGRILENDITFFNNQDELIFLIEGTNTPLPVRTVVRASVRGREVLTEVPPLPGAPPPEPFAAIKRASVRLDRITRAGRAYVTTPPACPRNKAWVNTVAFTYRDGVKQTERSTVPCRR